MIPHSRWRTIATGWVRTKLQSAAIRSNLFHHLSLFVRWEVRDAFVGLSQRGSSSQRAAASAAQLAGTVWLPVRVGERQSALPQFTDSARRGLGRRRGQFRRGRGRGRRRSQHGEWPSVAATSQPQPHRHRSAVASYVAGGGTGYRCNCSHHNFLAVGNSPKIFLSENFPSKMPNLEGNFYSREVSGKIKLSSVHDLICRQFATVCWNSAGN